MPILFPLFAWKLAADLVGSQAREEKSMLCSARANPSKFGHTHARPRLARTDPHSYIVCNQTQTESHTRNLLLRAPIHPFIPLQHRPADDLRGPRPALCGRWGQDAVRACRAHNQPRHSGRQGVCAMRSCVFVFLFVRPCVLDCVDLVTWRVCEIFSIGGGGGGGGGGDV